MDDVGGVLAECVLFDLNVSVRTPHLFEIEGRYAVVRLQLSFLHMAGIVFVCPVCLCTVVPHSCICFLLLLAAPSSCVIPYHPAGRMQK